MARTWQLIFLLITSFFIVLSCSKSGSGSSVDCSTVTNKAFAANIDPIIQSTCNIASCHATGSINGPGPLTNYSQVFAARSQVRAAISSGQMPQGSTLSQSQKNSIICWIDSGAPNN